MFDMESILGELGKRTGLGKDIIEKKFRGISKEQMDYLNRDIERTERLREIQKQLDILEEKRALEGVESSIFRGLNSKVNKLIDEHIELVDGIEKDFYTHIAEGEDVVIAITKERVRLHQSNAKFTAISTSLRAFTEAKMTTLG